MGEVDVVVLVIVVDGDEDVMVWLKVCGVLVNVVDWFEFCDFMLFVIVDWLLVIVVVGMGGVLVGLVKVVC